MKKKNSSDIDQQAGTAKKEKSNAVINALLIGIMIGIIVWSVAKSTVGLFTLIPLYIIFRLVNGPKGGKV